MGCHSLLQRVFLTQGSSPGLLHGRQILYHLSQQGSPNSKYIGFEMVPFPGCPEGWVSSLWWTLPQLSYRSHGHSLFLVSSAIPPVILIRKVLDHVSAPGSHSSDVFWMPIISLSCPCCRVSPSFQLSASFPLGLHVSPLVPIRLISLCLPNLGLPTMGGTLMQWSCFSTEGISSLPPARRRCLPFGPDPPCSARDCLVPQKRQVLVSKKLCCFKQETEVF